MNAHAHALDIRSHFSLTSVPFTREVPIAKRWRHPEFEQALAELKYTIEQYMSAAVIAPAGFGKTVLLRTLFDQLPGARYRVSYVKVTDLGKRDMCREMALAVGCEPAGSYNFLVRRLQEHVHTVSAQEAQRCVLLLDEAHDMRPDVLNMLRLLTNFEMDSRLLLSIVLSGQPHLGTLLRRDDLAAFSRRLNHFTTLRQLSREESADYVRHRMTIAGSKQDVFDNDCQEALFEITQGNLRAIDTLALKALQVASLANSPVVTANHVAQARAKVQP